MEIVATGEQCYGPDPTATDFYLTSLKGFENPTLNV